MSEKKVSAQKDSRKDKVVRLLTDALKEAGYAVRREELKRGPGWKTVSGSCRLEDQKLIFVDKRMPIEEQAAFLLGQLNSLGISPSEELSKELNA